MLYYYKLRRETALAYGGKKGYNIYYIDTEEEKRMKHIKTVNKPTLQSTVNKGGCGECQASCQSACKTSCTVGNQTCEK